PGCAPPNNTGWERLAEKTEIEGQGEGNACDVAGDVMPGKSRAKDPGHARQVGEGGRDAGGLEALGQAPAQGEGGDGVESIAKAFIVERPADRTEARQQAEGDGGEEGAEESGHLQAHRAPSYTFPVLMSDHRPHPPANDATRWDRTAGNVYQSFFS